MPWFRVHYTIHVNYEFEVDAESEEAARREVEALSLKECCRRFVYENDCVHEGITSIHEMEE